LQIFSEKFAGFLSTHISTLQAYLKFDSDGKTPDGIFDQKVAQSTASIFRNAIPESQDLDTSLLAKIETDLIAILVGRGNVPLIEVAVPCLCEIAAKTGKYTSTSSILTKCVGFLQKIYGLQRIPGAAFMNFVKSLLIVSLIVRNVDLNSIAKDLGETGYEALFGRVFHLMFNAFRNQSFYSFILDSCFSRTCRLLLCKISHRKMSRLCVYCR
jgi:hypothetical protein